MGKLSQCFWLELHRGSAGDSFYGNTTEYIWTLHCTTGPPYIGMANASLVLVKQSVRFKNGIALAKVEWSQHRTAQMATAVPGERERE